MAMGIQCRSATQSHDDHDNFDGQPHSPMTSIHYTNHFQPFCHPTGVTVSQFDAQCINNTSSTSPMVLQEIPTRISPNTTPNAIVNANNDKDLNLHHMMHQHRCNDSYLPSHLLTLTSTINQSLLQSLQ